MASASLLVGDMRATLRALPDNSIDSVCVDPPYHLASIVKRFGKEGSAPAQFGSDGAFARASRGFMGKEWDGGDISYDPATWYEVLRVLKPGGHMCCFGGSRTYHRIAVAIEDAGFELRDTLMWLYGTGFPKSHDVSKGIDKHLGTDGKIIPVGNPVTRMIPGAKIVSTGSWIKDPAHTYQPGSYSPGSPEASAWQGWGTALKPAFEPIIMARKPLEGTVASNTLKWGCGGINIDASRIPASGRPLREKQIGKPDVEGHSVFGAGLSPGSRAVGSTDAGRFPANVLHDGSDEVLSAFPDAPGQQGRAKTDGNPQGNAIYGALRHGTKLPEPQGDTGSAARFFYSAKASAKDRDGSKHPTVKPQALMRYLVKLITPPNGTVLDCFAGSGSTGVAAVAEGFNTILCEREDEYVADIQRRVPGIRVFRPTDSALKAEAA